MDKLLGSNFHITTQDLSKGETIIILRKAREETKVQHSNPYLKNGKLIRCTTEMKGIQKREFLSCCMSYHISIKLQVHYASVLLSPLTSLSVIIFLVLGIIFFSFLFYLSVPLLHTQFLSHCFILPSHCSFALLI